MSIAPPVRTVLLVGLMGSGKSTVARAVGELTDRDVLDTDEMVESGTGRTVREIFATEGEEAFRRLEHDVLVEALGREHSVVAAAGGAVCRAESLELVERHRREGSCWVVWLTAPVATLERRVVDGSHRPLLDRGAREALERMAKERDVFYASLADLIVDTSVSDEREVARLIARESDGVEGCSVH